MIAFDVNRGPDLDGDTDDNCDDSEHGDVRPGPSNGHTRPMAAHGKPKTAHQKRGEALLKKIVSEVEGESYSYR